MMNIEQQSEWRHHGKPPSNCHAQQLSGAAQMVDTWIDGILEDMDEQGW